MPNRILRDGILTSEPVCSLNWPAEVFYRRLMSVADDHGRFYATPKLIRSACYPLQIDKVSDSDIEKWLTACVEAALVRVYPAEDGKRYLEVIKFGQQVRSKSKYPEPSAAYLLAIASNGDQPPANALLGVVVFEGEGVSPSGKPTTADAAVVEVFEFWKTTMKHPKAALDDKRKKLIAARLKDYSVEDLKAAITGCTISPHHMGKNEHGTVYDSIELILRDAGHVDKFIAMKPAAGSTHPVARTPLREVPAEWWKTPSGVAAKGRQLGISEDSFGGYLPFKKAVIDKAGPGPWSPQ